MSLVKRDKNGHVMKGSASPNQSNQRRMNRMREMMDEKFGDSSEKLIDHLSKIAFGEMSVRTSKTLKSIRKRQGNDAVFDPELNVSDREAILVPSIREMLDATTVLLQYHQGKPQQSVDIAVEHTETKKLDFSRLSVAELEAYTKALEKLAEDNEDLTALDVEFKTLPNPSSDPRNPGDGA